MVLLLASAVIGAAREVGGDALGNGNLVERVYLWSPYRGPIDCIVVGDVMYLVVYHRWGVSYMLCIRQLAGVEFTLEGDLATSPAFIRIPTDSLVVGRPVALTLTTRHTYLGAVREEQRQLVIDVVEAYVPLTVTYRYGSPLRVTVYGPAPDGTRLLVTLIPDGYGSSISQYTTFRHRDLVA